jgi:hypothetical protein
MGLRQSYFKRENKSEHLTEYYRLGVRFFRKPCADGIKTIAHIFFWNLK